MQIKYPYSKQNISKKDINAVIKTLKSSYITQGSEVKKLEDEISKTMGAKYAVVVNSGTAALHISYYLLGVKKNKGILTSPITFLSTANTAALLGGQVYFTDVDKETGLMTQYDLLKSLDKLKLKNGVVVPVHLAGKACDMVNISMIARKKGLQILEDASHAPLAQYSDKNGRKFKVGACSHSDITIMSMHAIKHIAMGEGGVILTNNMEYAEKAKKLRNHGIIRDSKKWTGKAAFKNAPWYYEMHDIGWNYRATEMQCALGKSQLLLLQKSLNKINIIANEYYKYFNNIDVIKLPKNSSNGELHSYHLFPILINYKNINNTRVNIMNKLKVKGIGTQVHYIPLFYQPYYSETDKGFPGAVAYYNSTLSIPMYIGLNKKDIKYISQSIIEAIYEKN